MTTYCPESPRDLGLDKDTWWEGQREAVDAIIDSFYSGKKYVMAAIPTGGGKTIIASAVQKILAGSDGDAGCRSLALTHTLQLQAQYQKTLSDAAVITGRGNHACDLDADHPARVGLGPDERLTAENAPCSEGDDCHLKSRYGCGYYRQFWAAADAPMVVMNYAYAARILEIPQFKDRDADELISNPFRRELLVADECHLASDALVDAAGFKLYRQRLSDMGIDLPHESTRLAVVEGGPRSKKTVLYENVPLWVAWAEDNLDDARYQAKKAKEDYTSLSKGGAEARRIGQARTKALRFKQTAEALKALSDVGNANEWIITRDSQQGRVYGATVKPIWSWTVAQSMLFRHFERVLLMSATPGAPDIARVKLGIEPEEFEYIERPSTFPVENRPVIFWPVAKLSYTSTEADWEKIADAISKVGGQFPNRKGLVHSGSHANAARLVALLNRRFGWERALSHGGDSAFTREGALQEFVGASEPRVLVTASFTTGLDLPYIIGWQVIAKVPFGSLADPITAKRKAFVAPSGDKFGQRAYTDDAMNTVVQAAGRIVRAPDDSGPTFIVDENYRVLHAQAYMPKFYIEAFRRMTL